MRDWGNIDDRFDVWKIIKYHDGNDELNKKTSKLYEILTILSALCCGSLIGLSNSKNEIKIILYIYDGIRAYGIISSVFSGVISISMCSLINATSNKNTIKFIAKSIKFSNIPFFNIIFSLICLLLCTSFYFETYIMISILPFSLSVIFYSFYFYNTVHQNIYDIVHEKENIEILDNNDFNNIDNI